MSAFSFLISQGIDTNIGYSTHAQSRIQQGSNLSLLSKEMKVKRVAISK
jgi:hypothetical protein